MILLGQSDLLNLKIMYTKLIYLFLLGFIVISCNDDDDLDGYGDNNIAKIRITPTKEVLYQSETINLTAEFVYGDGSVKDANSDVTWTMLEGVGNISANTGTTVNFTSNDIGTASIKLEMDDYSGKIVLDVRRLFYLTTNYNTFVPNGQSDVIANVQTPDGKINGEDINWTGVTSSINGAATISEQINNRFIVTGSEVGTTTISVEINGITETLDLNVTKLVDLDFAKLLFEDSGSAYFNNAGFNIISNATFSENAHSGSGALSFDGSNYLIIDKNEYINGGQDYSVSYWFKTSTDAGGQNALWTMSRFTGDIENDPWLPGGLTFRYTADGVNYDVGWEGGAAGSATVADDKWHHLVATVDFTDEDSNRADIKMYIDGKEVVSNNNNIIQPTWGQYWGDWTGAAPVEDFVVKIGYSNSNGDAAVPFTGLIDDLKITRSVLSAAQVTEIYNQ